MGTLVTWAFSSSADRCARPVPRWSRGGPANQGIQRVSAVNGGQRRVTGGRAKSLVRAALARVGVWG